MLLGPNLNETLEKAIKPEKHNPEPIIPEERQIKPIFGEPSRSRAADLQGCQNIGFISFICFSKGKPVFSAKSLVFHWKYV